MRAAGEPARRAAVERHEPEVADVAGRRHVPADDDRQPAVGREVVLLDDDLAADHLRGHGRAEAAASARHDSRCVHDRDASRPDVVAAGCFARAHAAADGAAALACFTASPEAFDVVLLDLLMPVLDGHETFARLRARRPRLPVVVMSGYDPSAGGAERLVEQGAVFLQKPFTCDALATALNRALADARV